MSRQLLRRAAVAVGLACSLGPASAAAQSTSADRRAARPEVTDLEFRGVESLDEDLIRESIATEESRCRSLLFQPFCWFSTSPLFVEKHYLDPEELERDRLRIRVIYWRHGFREALASAEVAPTGEDEVSVVFTIEEREPTVVSRITVERPEGLLTDRQIERVMQLRAGQPLNLLRLDTSIVLLRQALWDRGYSDAVIDTAIALDEASRRARITIGVDPRWRATVERIVIAGNERISDNTILNSITLRPGGIYRRSEVLRSQRNLYESNLFQYATIVVPPQGDSAKLIEVMVQEAPLQEVRATAGFNTADFIQVEGRYVNRNWYGRARRLEARAVLGNLFAEQLAGTFPFRDVTEQVDGDPSPFLRPNVQASLDLRQPWFLRPENTAVIGIFAHRRSQPGIFIERGYGTNATLTREVAVRVPVSLSYRFEITSIDASEVYFCVSFGVCDEPTVELLQERQRLAPLALVARVDRGNNPLSRTRGYVAQADLEHASGYTGSDFRYHRAYAEGAVYRPLRGGRWVLASRLRLGWVEALAGTLDINGDGAGVPADVRILHPRKRFYAGGSQSVRGFGENQLGPRILTIPPETLRGLTVVGGDTTYRWCDASIPIQDCPVNIEGLSDSDFQPRPLGGTSLAEANVELRFRLMEQLTGAVFVDAAIVGERGLPLAGRATGAITPGFGIRYFTPVGPIRVDIGVNPVLAEQLPVVSQERLEGERQLVTLNRERVYAPGTEDRGLRRVLSRLTLHLSIGEAF